MRRFRGRAPARAIVNVRAPQGAAVEKPRLQVIVASTRPGRLGESVGAWVAEQAVRHAGFVVELIDLARVNLPLYDESRHPRLGQYEHPHTRAWADLAARADAYVFVTPEYNFGAPPSLINALDYLAGEWAYKPVGFASYGGVSGGTRAVQMIKQIVTTLRMMPIPEAVAIPFFTQYLDEATGRFAPDDGQTRAASTMFDELVRWSRALRPLRNAERNPPAQRH
jgi:NAD(P)H-dependent FMN reductase